MENCLTSPGLLLRSIACHARSEPWRSLIDVRSTARAADRSLGDRGGPGLVGELGGGLGRLRSRGPADPGRELLRLPRPRRQRPQGRPPPRPQGGRLPRPARRPGDRAGRRGVERADPPAHRGRPRTPHAPAEEREVADRRPGRDAPPMGGRGGPMARPLGVHPAETPEPARGPRPGLAPEPDRHVPPGLDGVEGAQALARGRPPDPDPPALARPDRPAADDRRGRRLRGRRPARRLRAAGRPPPRLAPPRRADGPGAGSTPPATPTPTAITSTTIATSGSIASGSSTPSTGTCRSTGSPSSRWRATSCPTPRSSRRSPAASTGTRWSTSRAGPTPRST